MKNNGNLSQRKEATREKRQIQIVRNVQFELNEIKKHFSDSLQNIKNQFVITEGLMELGKVDECKQIWRAQIVFLESILDFYIHELTKYAMLAMFRGDWEKNKKYYKYKIPMEAVEKGINNPENTDWLLEFLNKQIARDTYQSVDAIKDQMKMIGVDFANILEAVFPTKEEGEKIITEIYKRRNQIAHQMDRKHENAEQENITKEYVEECIDSIERLVDTIHKVVESK